MGGNVFRMEGSIQKKKKWKTVYWCWPEGYKFAMKDKKLMLNCRSMSVTSILVLLVLGGLISAQAAKRYSPKNSIFSASCKEYQGECPRVVSMAGNSSQIKIMKKYKIYGYDERLPA